MERYLVLEDGSVYRGQAFGAPVERNGEVVFTTGMMGYQEAITDQSFANQLLVFTNPLLGNYGVNFDDNESLAPRCQGVICQEIAQVPSNWRMTATLPEFLAQHQIPGIAGIDTRALTRKLREHGTLRGALVNEVAQVDQIIKTLQTTNLTANSVAQVSTKTAYPNPGTGRNVVVIDYGAKHSILRELARRHCNTIVLPWTATADEVLQLHPDGVLLSNGPGDPAEMQAAVKTVQTLQTQVPVFGICLGHQILAQANGAKTFKLKFGHRGFNHPVRDLVTNRVMMTSQNHGYAVDRNSIDPQKLAVTYEEINDQTVEGIRSQQYPAFSVQFHPDAAPGPLDAVTIFDDFMALMDRFKEEQHAKTN